jgi:hypothetical protein
LAGIGCGIGVALGEFIGRHQLLIPQMAQVHGTVNALGFSLSGMLGWYLSRREDSHNLAARTEQEQQALDGGGTDARVPGDRHKDTPAGPYPS